MGWGVEVSAAGGGQAGVGLAGVHSGAGAGRTSRLVALVALPALSCLVRVKLQTHKSQMDLVAEDGPPPRYGQTHEAKLIKCNKFQREDVFHDRYGRNVDYAYNSLTSTLFIKLQYC